MKEIYWLVVLGNLNTLLMIILSLLLVFGIAVMIGFLADGNKLWDEECSNFFKKYLLIIGITSIVFCFIPSKQDLLAIYGIGGTIDYIQSNDKAKELPDKVVDALTEYLEHVNDNKDDESK